MLLKILFPIYIKVLSLCKWLQVIDEYEEQSEVAERLRIKVHLVA